MRDPDLVVRAQQAATELESAWCYWRSLHGLSADPKQTVSSYVGYSLEAPWGEARIVFGVSAEDAELLAKLLEGHDCVGPVHASVQARPVGPVSSGTVPAGAGSAGPGLLGGAPGAPDAGPGRWALPSAELRGSESGADQAAAAGSPVPAGHDAGEAADTGRRRRPAAPELTTPAGDLVRIPAPAPASAGQQPLRTADTTPRQGRRVPGSAAAALTDPMLPGRVSHETPIALAASRAIEASMASRRQAASGSTGSGSGQPGPYGDGVDGTGEQSGGRSASGDTDDHPDPEGADLVGSALAAPVDFDPPPAFGTPGRTPPAPPATDWADSGAATVIGGLPAVPASDPYSWVAALRPDSRPASGAADPAGASRETQRSAEGQWPAGTNGAGYVQSSDPAGRPGQPTNGHDPAQWPADMSGAGYARSGDSAGRPAQPAGNQDPQTSAQSNPADPGAPEIVAFRPRPAAPYSAGWPFDDSGPIDRTSPAADQGSADRGGVDRSGADRSSLGGRSAATESPDLTSTGLIVRGPIMSRLARPASGQLGSASPGLGSPGGQSADRDRTSAASADAATWAASELPGQAAITDTAV